MTKILTTVKKSFARTVGTRFIAVASALICLIAVATSNSAIQFKEARVTQIVKDVKVLPAQAAPRPATVSELVRTGAAVRTGTQSRSELTFPDLTITRLGANTIFSFNEGTREMNLVDGAILFQVPKGQGGATVKTVAVTATITGTTGIAEYHPATTSHPQLFSKWLCLEGTFTVTLANGQIVELGPGKMVTTDGKSFSKIQTFDIAKLVATSLFFTGFDTPLASMDLIMLEAQRQADLIAVDRSTNPLDPIRLFNTIDQGITAESPTSPPITPTVTPHTPTPPPPPSKFGTPSTITAPNPYVITSGTTITTDPSITTNGVTDFGKIYRGPTTKDGAFSLWAFGSTLPFDTLADDVFFADPNHFPIATFKFQSLSLNGNPTIDLSNGGVTKLALIGVNGITSGAPGGPLTFTGLDLLVLATVNGSINLTPDVSFQGLPELAMYARGAGSNLILNSPITNVGILELAAQGSILLTNPGTMRVGEFDAVTGGGDLTLQIGGSLLTDGTVRLDTLVLPGTTVASGANLTLNIIGDYTNSGTESSRLRVRNDGAHIGAGGNIIVNIGRDLTTTGPAGDFELVVQNTNGRIDNGGKIFLGVDGRIDVAGALTTTLDNTGGIIGSDATISLILPSGSISVQGDATFQILNSDDGAGGSPGQINGNAIIGIGSGGNFSANSLTAIINDRHGGSIGSSAAVALDIGGTLSTTGDVLAGISTRNDGTGGGTIGSGATMGLSAGSISVGGAFTTFVSTNGGGSITGDAINQVGATTGDLVAQGPISVSIADTGFNQINPTNFIAGGHIGGDATVTLAAQNITTSSTATGVPGIDVMALEASIYTNGQGTIGGNAIVNVLASQAISAPGTVFFTVANGNFQNFGAGTIGGDAQLNVTAGSLSTGALFDDIYNYGGGRIGRDAIISMSVSNSFTATGNAEFLISNPSGTITRDALINLGAGDISAPSLTAEIDNSSGGMIGGNASINISAANVVTANSLLAVIDNSNGGHIGGSANLNLNLTGDLTTTQGNAAFSIYNNNNGSGGGTITGNAIVTASLGNLTSAPNGDFTALVVQIDNRGGNIVGSGAGTIGAGNAAVGFAASGNVNAQGNAFLQILNYNSGNGPGAISGSALLGVSAVNFSTAGFLYNAIDNGSGGSIIGDADLGFNLTGNLITQGEAGFFIFNGTGAIGGNAGMSVNAANITADSLFAQIDNTGGTVGVDATIDMNVSGRASVTNDATVAIFGSSGAKSAAININGGSYDVGGTLLAYMDGNGTITFNNASAHAEVLKAGVFGDNGTLRIGGGMLSADNTLKLYASGSNGQLEFVSNLTLGGNSLKILAANSVTIFNNVVVTIGGTLPADVYTNHANYTGFGGNGTTTGTFAGAGANRPQPLINAPPFGSSLTPIRYRTSGATIPSGKTTRTASGSDIPNGKTIRTAINVRSSDELLSLLDDAARGPDGKITVRDSKTQNHSRNANNIGGSNRSNAAGRVNSSLRAGIRTASLTSPGRLPQ